MKILKSLVLVICLGFLVSCSAFGPNRAYVYPTIPGTEQTCEGVGQINNLETGTDLATQFGIVLIGIEVERARDDLIKGFEEFVSIMNKATTLTDPTSSTISDTVALANYLQKLVVDINGNYSVLVVMLTPALNKLLQQDVFTTDKLPLGYCDFHRLAFWGESNINNLKGLK